MDFLLAGHVQRTPLRDGGDAGVPELLETPQIQALYENLDAVQNARAERLTSACESRGSAGTVANLSSIWTVGYSRPSRYNWMLQYFLRAEGLALSWVGTGRLIFSLNLRTPTSCRGRTASARGAHDAAGRAVWWADPARSARSPPAPDPVGNGPPTVFGSRHRLPKEPDAGRERPTSKPRPSMRGVNRIPVCLNIFPTSPSPRGGLVVVRGAGHRLEWKNTNPIVPSPWWEGQGGGGIAERWFVRETFPQISNGGREVPPPLTPPHVVVGRAFCAMGRGTPAARRGLQGGSAQSDAALGLWLARASDR